MFCWSRSSGWYGYSPRMPQQARRSRSTTAGRAEIAVNGSGSGTENGHWSRGSPQNRSKVPRYICTLQDIELHQKTKMITPGENYSPPAFYLRVKLRPAASKHPAYSKQLAFGANHPGNPVALSLTAGICSCGLSRSGRKSRTWRHDWRDFRLYSSLVDRYRRSTDIDLAARGLTGNVRVSGIGVRKRAQVRGAGHDPMTGCIHGQRGATTGIVGIDHSG